MRNRIARCKRADLAADVRVDAAATGVPKEDAKASPYRTKRGCVGPADRHRVGTEPQPGLRGPARHGRERDGTGKDTVIEEAPHNDVPFDFKSAKIDDHHVCIGAAGIQPKAGLAQCIRQDTSVVSDGPHE